MNINEEKYTPMGLVQIEDVESGEIVYETHNMIVETGRKRILHSLFPTDGASADDFTSGDLYKFYENNHRNLTVPNMTISTSSVVDPSTQCALADIVYDGQNADLSEIVLSMNSYDIGNHDDGRKLYIRTGDNPETDTLVSGNVFPAAAGDVLEANQSLVIKFNDVYSDTNRVIHICCSNAHTSAGKAITGVGLLFFKNGSTATLFSRAAVDPIFMRPGRHYIMHYTLSF